MKDSYISRLGLHRVAIADLFELEDGSFLLSRINVPLEFRSRGHGTSLLERVLEDADYEGVVLKLEINPYGSLDYDQLKDWYIRHGFEEAEDGLFVRTPR